MKRLKKQYSKNFDFSDLNEKDIIYFCRDSLTPYRNHSQKVQQEFENEILSIIQSKEWDWSIKDIDKNTILTYPIYNNAHSIVKYLLDNKKYDVKTYDKDMSNSLCSCITILGDKMLKNIMEYGIHPKYIDDMINKAYLYASIMSEKDTCEVYLNTASYLLEKNLSLNNISPYLFNGTISHLILNNNENKYPYLKTALHHLLENYPLDIKKKDFHVKKFFDPIIWKSKKLPQDISSCLENWRNYHSLNNELIKNNKIIKKFKI
jgi:hypothetical protein